MKIPSLSILDPWMWVRRAVLLLAAVVAGAGAWEHWSAGPRVEAAKGRAATAEAERDGAIAANQALRPLVEKQNQLVAGWLKAATDVQAAQERAIAQAKADAQAAAARAYRLEAMLPGLRTPPASPELECQQLREVTDTARRRR